MSKPPRRRPSVRLRCLLLGIGLVLAGGATEALLHAVPQLLPTWYRERFPPHGIEFLHPGLLDRTALTAIPLPYGVQPYDGPPPHQLVDLGVAPWSTSATDAAATPHLVLPADAEGLPNAEPLATADLALVGDSFAVFASQQQPAGLQQALARDLGVRIVNVGISGIGPDQELWLLQNRVLPKKPRLVVWLFFGGNDLIDAYWQQHNLAHGMRTFGDMMATRRAPRLILPSLLAALCTANDPLPSGGPFAGFALLAEPSQRVWFVPDSLRVMTLAPELLTTNPGWLGIENVLRQAKAACDQASAKLLLVYVPGKDHIYLPRVDLDPEQLQRTVSMSILHGVPMPTDAVELRNTILQHRLALETALLAFAQRENLLAWSARPSLEAAADRGVQTFYVSDTHWTGAGQLAVAADLVPFVQQQRLLDR